MDRHEQLARIQGELADASRRAHEIAARLENEQWRTRPAGDQWSVAECLIHLNMTSQAFLPLIRDLLGKGRNQQVFRSTSAWMDFVGRLLWLAVTVRVPIKTTEPFVPGSCPTERHCSFRVRWFSEPGDRLPQRGRGTRSRDAPHRLSL
jgi:hypothetical protein